MEYEFEDWFEDALLYALTTYGDFVATHMAKYPFMYEDYYDKGLTPELGVDEEWGM